MKLPILWLKDYLAYTGADVTAACQRWGIEPHKDAAHALGALFTFSGFACDGVHGHGDAAVVELDVLSNRPDCQCVLGLARELAAVLRVPLKQSSFDVVEKGAPAGDSAKVRVEDARTCPRYTARIIRGVKVGPSPKWLQERLVSMGLTPRNNIVDVTNFILFELGHPLHAFDLKKLAGQQIVVRRAKDKEAFKPLYGEVPLLTSETLVIADAEKPVAVGGVIGGAGSEVEESTTDILLEAACFEPTSIRRTCRRLKVGTDSSYRFERGVDIEGVERASARAARLIVEAAGGTVAKGLLDSQPRPLRLKEINLRFERLRGLYGVHIPSQKVVELLSAIGCEIVRENAAEVVVLPPSWRRHDLHREVDLIEDVARLHGYNHVPAATAMSARIPPRAALEVAADRTRELLSALGYFEAISNSLIDPRWPSAAVWTNDKPLQLDMQSVLSKEHSLLRNTLLISLLDLQRHNQNHRTGTVRLFECNKVFLAKSDSPRPEERPVLGILDELGFQHISDALQRLPEALQLDGARIALRPAEGQAPEFLTPETACRIVRVRETSDHERAEDSIGWAGVVHPKLAQAFDIRKAPAMAELNLGALAAVSTAPRRYAPLPTQPENARDVALVVDEGVAWHDIEGFTRSYATHEPLRDRGEGVRFLSVFRGKQLGAGKKSVAFSVIYRLPDRSLCGIL